MNLFLDSGAYSAESQGTPIVLSDYIQFIHDHYDEVGVYANLDVIKDVDASWRNQQTMEDAGLNPLPVYHMEDPFSYLHKCLEYPYFCLGGMAGASAPARITFLDKCWESICDTPDGTPKSKVHGFGMSSPILMCRYPWYSVDSSSWVQYGLHGMLLVPRVNADGSYNYNDSPVKVFVSTRSPHKGTEGRHFESMTPAEQENVLAFIHSKGHVLGESKFSAVQADYKLQLHESFANKEKSLVEYIITPGVSNNGVLRDIMNYIYFMDLGETRPSWPWAFKPNMQRLF